MKRIAAKMRDLLFAGCLVGLPLGSGACDDGSDPSSEGSAGTDGGQDGGNIEDIVEEMAGNTVRMDPEMADGGVEEWWLGLEQSGSVVACNCSQEFPEATWEGLGSDSLRVTFPNGSDDPPTETYTFYDTASDGRSGKFDVVIANAIEMIEMSGTWTLVDGTDVCPAPPC
jgi:hypothetical protein